MDINTKAKSKVLQDLIDMMDENTSGGVSLVAATEYNSFSSRKWN